MADVRTAASRDSSRTPGRRLAERLSGLRWLIVGCAVLLAIVYASGLMSFIGVVVVLAGVVMLSGFVPLSQSPAQTRSIVEPQPQTWPETGVKLFAEALPDPCFVLDRRGIVRFVNASAADAFPIRPGEPLASRLRIPELIAAFERVAGGEGPERVEFSQRVPTERWFAAWFARLDTDAGGDFVVLILDDLSERRRIDRIRVDFVANASHELRTPLASLAGFIETLQGAARDDQTARERFLAIMHEQATRMSRLIDDLLSLSRIELKVHVKPSDPVDLVPVLNHVTEALEPLARELDVAIEAALPDEPAIIVGDRDELIQVFENLIENAIKYGQSGKRVVVAIERPGAETGPTVTVRDFGPGIAEEFLPRLTERFYRIDVEASRQHRGTGLGLAIVKHILARHGARLVIESRPGEGAVFTVIFPRGGLVDDSGVKDIIKEYQ